MKTSASLKLAAALALLVQFGASTASADTTSSAPPTMAPPQKYTCTIDPQYGRGRQWTGSLAISIDPAGNVTGKYKSTSTIPDPFYSENIKVTGHEKGKQMELVFHMVQPATFKIEGQFFGSNYNGTATNQNANTFNFLAQRLH
ncbi:MAG TPA: hypothetical protein VKF82_02635 [Candidatus Eremiobacteraceae bacterium]|nr:hypothetical protein [Candidatus Eremiobacteraceae bacterium]